MTTTAQPTTRTYTTIRGGRTVVSRTTIDGPHTGRMIFEIALWRHGRRRPTFQGTITLTGALWCATDANGADCGTHTNYVDAETALTRARTGVRSTQAWGGPHPTVPVKETCRVCGWELTPDGWCTRPDLHWTAASLAAR